ncbi:MAG: hypothetical protein B7X00_00745 [Legionella sp. 21-45-4]|nr:MAG: hypothetical protein B7X00_00745 [Legionella sp. 21-45-4]
MKDIVITHWKKLEEREQLALMVGIVFCILVGGYWLFYLPLVNAIEARQRQLQESRNTLAWIKQVKPLLDKKKSLEVLSSSHLLTVLSDQLAETALKQYPYQLQQASKDSIQLGFEEVTYTTFMSWLNQVSNKYAFTIKQLVMDAIDKPGMMKVLLLIQVTPHSG